jgi:hypothetical protein
MSVVLTKIVIPSLVMKSPKVRMGPCIGRI